MQQKMDAELQKKKQLLQFSKQISGRFQNDLKKVKTLLPRKTLFKGTVNNKSRKTKKKQDLFDNTQLIK